MRKLPILIAALLLLTGCSNEEMDSALSLERKAPPAEVVRTAPSTSAPPAAIAPQVAEPANAAFCRSVATQDATTHSFDAATQRRVFAQRYNECLTLHGN
jgi:hypothetical protein